MFLLSFFDILPSLTLLSFSFAAPGICKIWGDPHYLTFDSRQYLLQGDCEYTLVVPCDESGDINFLLSGNNAKDKPSGGSSMLHEILFFFGNVTYSIRDGVMIDDVTVTLPYRGRDGVFIYLQSPKVVRYRNISSPSSQSAFRYLVTQVLSSLNKIFLNQFSSQLLVCVPFGAFVMNCSCNSY